MIEFRSVALLSAALVLAALLSGGVYQVSSTERYSHVVNRLTGSAWVCGVSDCEPVGPEAR